MVTLHFCLKTSHLLRRNNKWHHSSGYKANTSHAGIRRNSSTIAHGRGLHRPGAGLGLVAQIMFGPGPNNTNQTLKRTSRAFSGHSFIVKKKLFVVALILCSWHSRAQETNPTDLIFSGILDSCPLPEIVRDNTLQTWHPISLYHFPNAKITSDVLRASLNNSFKDYWHLCIKEHVLMIQWSG
jgi:hypothetical protein